MLVAYAVLSSVEMFLFDGMVVIVNSTGRFITMECSHLFEYWNLKENPFISHTGPLWVKAGLDLLCAILW